MSRTEKIIVLSPPEKLDVETQVEQQFVCPDCKGNGWNYVYSQGKRIKQKCERCMGSGRLYAYITINWKPLCETTEDSIRPWP